jgi:uncharacterized BrkB/YihY/UPF0761 family membrane protein
MTEPVVEEREGRLKRARRRMDGARHELTERATEFEARVPAARSAVRAYEHDRAVGGEIMAGAIAFRSFVFLLPLTLIIVLTLGIAADNVGGGAVAISQHAGVSGIAAASVTQSARVSSGGRFLALFLGLIALYSTSIALARALRIAHALAWGEVVEPMKRTWRAALVVPGAVLVGFGVLVLHVVTVFYITRRISTPSALYGTLGGAIAILVWAYFVGRLLVSSAVLNASLYREREQV